MSVACPHCQLPLSVHPSQAGTVVACPQCEGNFQVPVPTAYSGAALAGSGQTYGAYAGPSEVQQFASKKIAAGICGILLGGLGVHKFVLGFNTAGTIMLVISVVGIVLGACLVIPALASMAMSVIGLVEGIIYLTKSDHEFYQIYAVQKKEWF
jgi:TM2 domain-containing membrane protein YozV